MQPLLDSSRLVLRAFTLADAPRVKELAGDSRVAETTATVPHPYPDGAAEQWIAGRAAAFDARSEATFAITLRGDGSLVGCVSLLHVSATHARAELGYWVGVPFWGKGYCTEGVVRLMAFGLQEWKLTRIAARCMARNAGSARVMEKAGLLREGLLRAHMFKNGRYEDLVLYGYSHPSRTGA